MVLLIFTLCVVGYIVIAGIFNAILDYFCKSEYNDVFAMVWPMALLALPFVLLFEATYWLVTYFLKKMLCHLRNS